MAKLLPTFQRLITILKRQHEPRWGCEYQPAILSTPREAPSCSRPARLYWRGFGRDLHALSSPETAAILLALYHPRLFDLHEQRMLSPEPCPHPMQGHQRAHGLSLRPLRGTVEVAVRMELYRFHPTVVAPVQDTDDERHVPFPWIGDLLLFMQADVEPYCVNWNVKGCSGDHTRPFSGSHRGRPSQRSIERAQARYAIEAAYYRDAGIRTVDASLDAIPFALHRNLQCLFPETKSRVAITKAERDDIVDQFSGGMHAGLPPMVTMQDLAIRRGIEITVSRKILYQAIWYRRLRVDLLRPILMDKPLLPERVDILDRFAPWFER